MWLNVKTQAKKIGLSDHSMILYGENLIAFGGLTKGESTRDTNGEHSFIIFVLLCYYYYLFFSWAWAIR